MVFVIGRYERSIGSFVTLKLQDGRNYIERESEARFLHNVYFSFGALYRVDRCGVATLVAWGDIDPTLTPVTARTEVLQLLAEPSTEHLAV